MKHCAARLPFRTVVALILVLVVAPIPSSGWGPEGHLIINQIAANYAPSDMPGFFHHARARLAYLASEPDRWRDKQDEQLRAAQDPEHYIDLERVDWMTEFPRDRWQFVHALYDKRATAANPDDLLPERVGLVPYASIEVYERLRTAFRQYRQLKSDHQPTGPVEEDIVFYAGWLGHYIGDTSQPLHTTIHFDGWVGPNPHGYTVHVDPGPGVPPGVHWRFESGFVAANIKLQDVTPYMRPVQRLGDPFQDYLKFLRGSHSRVEQLYQFDKAKAFNGAGTPQSKKFAAEALASGAQMLVNMWYTAWLESGENEQKK